jgi:hypothetical protein
MRCTASAEPVASFLQRLDLLADLLGGALRLHRERLDLGRDNGKAAAGVAGACRFDRGVEREQRRLPRDLRDQADDIADRARGFAQAVDVEAGLFGCRRGLIGELAGRAHLAADAVSREGELFGRAGEGGCSVLRGAAASAQRVGALTNGDKGRGGGLSPACDRIGGALELADHAAKLKFQKLEDILGRVGLGGRHDLGRGGLRRLRLRGTRNGFQQSFFEKTERHGPLWRANGSWSNPPTFP